jgi:drug/metabolite transporter (DMT)-like permease
VDSPGSLIGKKPDRHGLFNVPTIIGVLCFILAFFFYYWSLRYVPLHLAQIAVSAQFAAIIVAAALILGETITPMRWAGVVVIVLGIAIASQS